MRHQIAVRVPDLCLQHTSHVLQITRLAYSGEIMPQHGRPFERSLKPTDLRSSAYLSHVEALPVWAFGLDNTAVLEDQGLETSPLVRTYSGHAHDPVQSVVRSLECAGLVRLR